MSPVRFLSIPCFLLCMTMFSTVWMGCRQREAKEEAVQPLVTGVGVKAVEPVQVDDVFEASATIRSESTSIVSSRVMALITSLHVREGEMVKRGQLLLTLDESDALSRKKAAAMAMEAARQNMDLTEATWRRYRNLYEEKAISAQKMDQFQTSRNVAKADYERAKAMAEEAETFLGFTRITSPVAGVVTKKLTDVGSMASPGAPLMVIEGTRDVYAEAAIDEGLSGRIKPGMPVNVTIDALGRSIQGRIREVLPDISPASRTFIVKIALADEDLRSGLYARARIPIGRKEVLLVPGNAVSRRGQLTGVYVVDSKGVVTYRLIREGMRYGNGVEVLSGLFGNERIIVSGIEKAVDGGIISHRALR